jgi:hypothetical protein
MSKIARTETNVIDLKARPKCTEPRPWVVTELPFVKDGNSWSVNPTGDYLADGKTGLEYAFAFMEFEYRKPAFLQGSGMPEIGIIVDMIKAGQDNEIVRNFFQTLVESSLAAWGPDHLPAMRAFYDRRDRHYAESKAREIRERAERRSAGAKKAWETRRNRKLEQV